MTSSYDHSLHHAEVLISETATALNLAAEKARAANQLVHSVRQSYHPPSEAISKRLQDAELSVAAGIEKSATGWQCFRHAQKCLEQSRPLP
jgi:hypothetical protein